MSKTIRKYPIYNNRVTYLPKDALILKADRQNGHDICIWALVDTENEAVSRTFKIYGTGWDLPDNPGVHINTFPDNDFVWHVFEVV